MANIQKCTNNGGTTDYYQLDPSWKQAQDIIEARGMNFSQGNILKAAFCFNVARHNGTDYERELRKIIWFAERELAVLEANRRVLETALDSQTAQTTQSSTKVEVCKPHDYFIEKSNADDLDGLKGVVIKDYGVERIGNADFQTLGKAKRKKS